MHKPIFASQEHRAAVESYIAMCLKFVEDVSSKTKLDNYLDVLDTIVEYHNNYGKGVRENNFYDWLMIIPINLSVATNGYFAAIETKRNAAIVRAYKVVLEQALQDVVDKIDLLEPKSE
tara:strand:+ start:1354 stop:1710 length:357 start_codon:yes stop_codon:yes gene_type:complete